MGCCVRFAVLLRSLLVFAGLRCWAASRRGGLLRLLHIESVRGGSERDRRRCRRRRVLHRRGWSLCSAALRLLPRLLRLPLVLLRLVAARTRAAVAARTRAAVAARLRAAVTARLRAVGLTKRMCRGCRRRTDVRRLYLARAAIWIIIINTGVKQRGVGCLVGCRPAQPFLTLYWVALTPTRRRRRRCGRTTPTKPSTKHQT